MEFLQESHMVKPILLIFFAIPVILAGVIAIPLITSIEVPVTAVDKFDVIEIEYTKHNLTKVSFGVTERMVSEKSEILIIKNNGDVIYTVIEDGIAKPNISSKITEDKKTRIIAMIKETGFMAIPTDSFLIHNNIDKYLKSNVKITLNGKTTQIFWPEQDSTEQLIPPIVTYVETELDSIINEIRN